MHGFIRRRARFDCNGIARAVVERLPAPNATDGHIGIERGWRRSSSIANARPLILPASFT
jgi:hypothetical protein